LRASTANLIFPWSWRWLGSLQTIKAAENNQNIQLNKQSGAVAPKEDACAFLTRI
jgi:hypothetical protein